MPTGVWLSNCCILFFLSSIWIALPPSLRQFAGRTKSITSWFHFFAHVTSNKWTSKPHSLSTSKHHMELCEAYCINGQRISNTSQQVSNCADHVYQTQLLEVGAHSSRIPYISPRWVSRWWLFLTSWWIEAASGTITRNNWRWQQLSLFCGSRGNQLHGAVRFLNCKWEEHNVYWLHWQDSLPWAYLRSHYGEYGSHMKKVSN